MAGLIAGFKVIFGFLAVCLLGGLFFYTILDLKPWRKEVYSKFLNRLNNKKKK